MGFDKVKINTASLLLLPLGGGGQTRGLHRTPHKHTRAHLPTDTTPAVILILTQTFMSYAPLTHPILSLPSHTHTVVPPRRGVCVLGINILPPSLLSIVSSRATPFASMDFHDNSFRKGPVFSPPASSSSFTLPRWNIDGFFMNSYEKFIQIPKWKSVNIPHLPMPPAFIILHNILPPNPPPLPTLIPALLLSLHQPPRLPEKDMPLCLFSCHLA